MTSKELTRFLLSARITLVLVFAVIIAGAVVRATGSGMGCPDWPKCFGHYIPPTEKDQLEFSEGKQFKKGYFIIWQDALWKAKHDLVAGKEIDPDDWEKYTKHDYAKFNKMHTWTEYVNRLLGVLLGISIFIMLLLSFKFRRSDAAIFYLSLVAFILVGFEGWLGAKVVDSNLAPVKITTHMIVSLILLALIIYIIQRAALRVSAFTANIPSAVRTLLLIAIIFSLAQTVLGTQVRENVDEISKAMDDQHRELWVEQLGTFFNVHRLFALLVLIVNATMVVQLFRNIAGPSAVKTRGAVLLMLLVLELIAGAVLANFGIPLFMQPVHLLLAMIIFGLQFRMWMDIRKPALT
jgi:cytochrome c oxidase assembly protein subunit 15